MKGDLPKSNDSSETLRDAWIKRHKIILSHTNNPRIYIASIEGRLSFGTGATEDDALLKLCQIYQIRFWTDEKAA